MADIELASRLAGGMLGLLADRREGGPANVERAVAVGRVGGVPPPRHDPPPLVVGVELHRPRIGRSRRGEE
jgi:hypothetical protein